MQVNLDLLPHQDDFIFTDSPHPAIIGGLGSGKSQAGTDRLLVLMMLDPSINTLYAMPTFDLLKLRAVPGFVEQLEKIGLKYRLNKSEMTIDISGLGIIYLRSYDNPDRFIAFEVGHAVVDELDTLKIDDAEHVWRKVNERVRQRTSKGINTIACVTTPDQGYNGFVYDKWVKKQNPNYQIIKASTYDNPFLPDGYTDQITANYDPVLADLYLKGEFVSLNQDKQFWAFNRQKHHSDITITRDTTFILVAIDFNVGGTVATLWQRRVVNGVDTLIGVDEIVGQNTQDTITKVNAKYPMATKVAYPDASGGNESANADLTSIALMQQAGWRIDAPQTNPSVRASINTVNNLLSKDKILVNGNTCPSLVSSLETLGYKDGKPEKFNSHPAPDDYCDGLRYIAHRLMPTIRPVTIVEKTGH